MVLPIGRRIIVLICGLTVSTELPMLWRYRAAAARSSDSWARAHAEEQKLDERSSMWRSALAERELLGSEIESMRLALLGGRGARGAEVPEKSTPVEALIEISRIIEECRKAAREAGVGLSADESFGLAVSDGMTPDAARAETLVSEARIIRAVVNALLDSGVSGIRSIRLGSGLREDETVGASVPGRDAFRLPSILALDSDERLPLRPLQVEFEGNADCLRRVLANLRQIRPAILVRCVEVDSAYPSDGRETSGEFPSDDWIVRPAVLGVTLTLESVDPLLPRDDLTNGGG